MEYYSAVKGNGIGSFVVMWMKLESVIQSEVSQKEKNKTHMLAHICGNFLDILLLSLILKLFTSVVSVGWK